METVGILGIALMILLFLVKVPVAFSMMITGILGFSYLTSLDGGLKLLSRDVYDQFSSFPLSAIPMFILMGSFAYASGIGRRLYNAAYEILGGLKGGLTLATVISCGAFAAICGSTAATAATIGRMAIPEMKRYGYEDSLATGSVAGAGTVGILIPPSTIFLVYGILTEQSIGKLFVAGIVPGVILVCLFLIAVFITCWLKPSYGPPATTSKSLRQKLMAFLQLSESVALFCLVIGGLFLGWFTPTQAGGIGAAGALFVGILRKELSWKAFWESTLDALRTSCMVLCIITGATIFGHFMAVTNIPFTLAEWIANLSIPPVMVMAVIILMYLVGGCFMDSMALVVLTVPVIFPVVLKLGFDPIWFGVIIVLVSEMGVITPPVGVNVYVIKGIAPDVPLEKIFKGVLPFLGAIMVTTAICVAFPKMVLFLPKLAY